MSAVAEQAWPSVQELVRLVLPPFARVVVLGEGPLPRAVLDDRPVQALGSPTAAEALERLDHLEAAGWSHLLVPSDDVWRRADPALRERIEALRSVASERGVRIFALHEAPPPAGRLARDGLPLPPPELIRLTSGQASPHRFYWSFVESGRKAARMVAAAAGAAGLELESARAILDFGCGCGRVLRNWNALDGVRVHGTDYNPYLIDWCVANLPFAEFEVNGGSPSLSYQDETFELVYGISVLTHLSEDLQRPWMEELRRIIVPGGLLILTLMGAAMLGGLAPAERERFAAGKLVVVADERSGTNACNAYHPDRYVRGELAAGFSILEHEPAGAREAAGQQDLLVLRRI